MDESDIKAAKIIGKNLTKLFKSKRGVQANFCKQYNTSPSRVGNYASGERVPKAGMLLSIKEFFQISLDDLFSDKFDVDSPSKPKEKIETLTLKEYQSFVDGGLSYTNAPRKITLADRCKADFCLDFSEIIFNKFCSVGLLFKLTTEFSMNDVFVCKINNKYGTSLVVAKYSESLKAPTLTNVKDSRGDVPDINLDEVDYEVVAVKVGIIGLQG